MAAAVAAGTLAVAAGLIFAAAPARSGSGAEELRPDLIVKRLDELYLTGKGKWLRLRFSNTIANRGNGPLEIVGGDGSDACHRPGKPPGRHTLQSVYRDSAEHSASSGYFRRADDTQRTTYEAGCSRFHPSHDHWHFDNFARYTLARERTGAVVGASRKVSFCVLDTGRPHPGLPGSPGSPYYPQDDENPSRFRTCSATSVDGLSIGWEDTYGASLPGQAIKLRARRGAYCLALEADPAGPGSEGGALAESREHNNVRTVRLAIHPRRKLVRRMGPVCRTRPA